ncbi:hypothetical protein NQ317_002204 [Molorchus minor]|uniref:Poly [ADP-ribose] polymerase n=1 Tax=Molorchus minor TaxID=1323400 RepID=A0ABQ9JNC8_9CUCU|nr:hypothetical protein NQ317_002204 [Molorchus minor]
MVSQSDLAFIESFATLTLKDEEPIQNNPDMLRDLLNSSGNVHFTWDLKNYGKEAYKLVDLEQTSSEYCRIKQSFDLSMKKRYTVTKIRVENPYLLVQYNLKKWHKQSKYVGCVERQLFHGTSKHNIEQICCFNFNWRLAGNCVGHRFGRGISFCAIINVFQSLPKKLPLPQRIMFVVDVLIGSSCIGSPLMTIPTGSCDTSQKPDGQVIVKYEDNDFYPKYIITYS